MTRRSAKHQQIFGVGAWGGPDAGAIRGGPYACVPEIALTQRRWRAMVAVCERAPEHGYPQAPDVPTRWHGASFRPMLTPPETYVVIRTCSQKGFSGGFRGKMGDLHTQNEGVNHV